MDDITAEQPPPRERIGSRAWVRTVGMVGGGLIAGGILAGTVTATAAENSTTDTPSVTHEEGMTTDGTTAPEDCPEGAGGPRGGAGMTPDDSTTPESSVPESGA